MVPGAQLPIRSTQASSVDKPENTACNPVKIGQKRRSTDFVSAEPSQKVSRTIPTKVKTIFAEFGEKEINQRFVQLLQKKYKDSALEVEQIGLSQQEAYCYIPHFTSEEKVSTASYEEISDMKVSNNMRKIHGRCNYLHCPFEIPENKKKRANLGAHAKEHKLNGDTERTITISYPNFVDTKNPSLVKWSHLLKVQKQYFDELAEADSSDSDSDFTSSTDCSDSLSDEIS